MINFQGEHKVFAENGVDALVLEIFTKCDKIKQDHNLHFL